MTHAFGWALSALLLTAQADSLVELWHVSPDERTYVTTGNTERGLGFNPVSGNMLLVSRAGSPQVYVLNGATGDDETATLGEPRRLNQLDAEGFGVISGGLFTLNLAAAAEDGAVYACSLATTASGLRIYRWANDDSATSPTVAWSGDPAPENAQRWGDNFTVRGAGLNTQILMGSRNGNILALFTTTDGETFTPTILTSDMAGGDAGLGVAFGAGNTIWTKASGRPLRHQSFDLAAGTATTVTSYPATVIPSGASPVGSNVDGTKLVLVDTGTHQVIVYDVSDPANPVQIGERFTFATQNANGNGVGAAVVGKLGEDEVVFALDTNNGPVALKIEKSVVADPPTIATQPAANPSVYAGAGVTLSVTAQGTPPLGYQWFFNELLLEGQTGSSLVLSNLTAAQTGPYLVVITNAGGSITSAPANLTVREPVTSPILTPLWALDPGSRPYLNEDSTQRGVAYNPVTGNVLMVSRTGGNQIVVLDGATGAEKHRLRTTDAEEFNVITGGTLAVNMIAVADDGAVFVGNLVTDGSASAFKLYRWENDAADTIPTVISGPFELAVAQRWGDTLDARGAGETTQLLVGSRSGNVFAVISIPDGFNAVGQVFEVPDAPNAAFGLGITFGADNTVWGTAAGQPLHHVSFDPLAGTATLVKSYPAAQVPTALAFIGVDRTSSLLAGVALETPDNVQLFDLADLENPVLVDQELILIDRPNVNGTGSVDFGGDKLFVLDSNNGLRAYAVDPDAVGEADPAVLSAVVLADGNVTFTLTGTPGATYEVLRATALTGGFVSAGTFQIPAGGSVTVNLPAGETTSFFRATTP